MSRGNTPQPHTQAAARGMRQLCQVRLGTFSQSERPAEHYQTCGELAGSSACGTPTPW